MSEWHIFINRHIACVLFWNKWHIIWCEIIINDSNSRFTQYFNLWINFEFCIIGYIWRNLYFNNNLNTLHKSNLWSYIFISINIKNRKKWLVLWNEIKTGILLIVLIFKEDIYQSFTKHLINYYLRCTKNCIIFI